MQSYKGDKLYVKSGLVQDNFTGLIKYNSDLLYVEDGKLQEDYTGVAQYSGDKYYVNEGKVDTKYTGLVKDGNDKVYVEKGKVNTTYTGFIEDKDDTVYLENGKVESDFTGLMNYNKDILYIEDGYVNKSYKGLFNQNDTYYYIKSGKVDTTYTELVISDDDEQIYIVNGKQAKGFTGLAQNKFGKWYVVDGIVNSDYTGMLLYNDVWKYLENGYVIEDYTGFANNEYGLWYIEDGEVAFDFTGIVTNDSGNWYVKSGIVQLDYYGYYTYNKKQYVVTEGYAVEQAEYDIINGIKQSSLYKKSIFCAGDSIAQGYGNDDVSYVDILTDRYSMNTYKSAKGGATISIVPDRESISQMVLNDMVKNYDYALLEGGWNDFKDNVMLGELSDGDYDTLNQYTFIGALEKTFRYIQTNHANTDIYFLIVHKIDETNASKVNALGLTFEDYYNAIITVCNKYSINVIDVYKDSDYNTAYQEYKADTLNGDGVHPLQKSFFKYYMPIIEKSMKY